MEVLLLPGGGIILISKRRPRRAGRAADALTAPAASTFYPFFFVCLFSKIVNCPLFSVHSY